MITIDNITQGTIVGSSITVSHSISSQDAVLVILVSTDSINNGSATLNNFTLGRLSGPNGTTATVEVYYVTRPPSGTNSVVVTAGAGATSMAVTVMSLLGVDKSITSPFQTATSGTNASTSTVSLRNISSATFQIDVLAATGINTAISTGNQIQNTPLLNASLVGASTYLSTPATQEREQLTWTFDTSTNSFVHAAVSLSPKDAYSISYPGISFRSNLDVINTSGLNTNNTPSGTFQYGYYPVNFFLNSFLHTVGRINPPPIQPTSTAETERPTSQIIIDKVFQGQIAAIALSTVSLTMDISIPSPDAVLVVTGGSVIATGAQWASVQFNGNPLTNLVQAIVAGADAEIWYMPFPPVGTGQLTITSGTGGEIYANAMVILGVDKRSTNIKVASVTDAAATSTIGVAITPNAPNSLIIDTLSTLDGLTPVQDSSQNQVFNATSLLASEEVLSSYKLGNTAGESMNWNLGISVNAALVAVAFRPANAASIWYPNIDFRSLNDVVDTNALDAGVNSAFGRYGYRPSTFYLNSFLHTIGKLMNFSGVPTPATRTQDLVTPSSTIQIDQITTVSGLATFQHNVSSQDAILLIIVTQVGANASMRVNGNPIPALITVARTSTANQIIRTTMFLTLTPPVGTVTIASGDSTAPKITAMTILGVDKKSLTPISGSNVNTSATARVTFTTPTAGSLVVNAINHADDLASTPTAATASGRQIQTDNTNYDQVTPNPAHGISYQYSNATTDSMIWNLVGANAIAWSSAYVVLEPNQAPSFWFPEINLRQRFDIAEPNTLNEFSLGSGNTLLNKSFGNFPAVFYLNSFLHTVGRTVGGGAGVVTTTSSTLLMMMGVG